jgi:hypothetical protein
MHTANWQVKWQQGSSRAKGNQGSTLHARVPMSAVDCMNSQSNTIYFYKDINFIVSDDERGLVAVSATPQ